MNLPLHKDIGIDEVNENLFSIYIIDEKGNVVASVYGKTADECDQNADELIDLINR